MTQPMSNTDMSRVYRQSADCEGNTTPHTVDPNATSNILKNQSWEIEIYKQPMEQRVDSHVIYPVVKTEYPLINLNQPGEIVIENVELAD